MDWPSLSELGTAASTVAFGPTVDPSTMAGAGLNTPVDENVRDLLAAKSRTGMAKSYEDWSREHPYLDFAAQRGVDALMNEIPYGRIARKAGLGSIVDILDMASSVGQHDWAGGMNIKDPKLKISRVEEDPDYEGAHTVHIEDRRTGKGVGSILLHHQDPEGKHGEIGWWEMNLPPDVGMGHVLDLRNQLGEHFPNMEDVSYSRVSGARDINNAPLQEVVMPIRRPAKAEEGLVPINLTPREKVPILNAVQRQSRVKRQTIMSPEGDPYPTNPSRDPLTARRAGELPSEHQARLQTELARLEELQRTLNVPDPTEHPVKRAMVNELANVEEDPDELMRWRDKSPTLKAVNEGWRQVIADDGQNGPYKLDAFRGGTHEPPPGLGKFYSNDPFHASAYDLSDAPMVDKMIGLQGKTIYSKKPLVIQHPDEAFSDPSLNMDHVMEKLNLDAKGQQTYRDLVKENSMPKLEQFIAKKAKENGHDSVLRYSPDEEFMELMDLRDE